jgi:hypothetical protein
MGNNSVSSNIIMAGLTFVTCTFDCFFSVQVTLLHVHRRGDAMRLQQNSTVSKQMNFDFMAINLIERFSFYIILFSTPTPAYCRNFRSCWSLLYLRVLNLRALHSNRGSDGLTEYRLCKLFCRRRLL